MTAAGIAVDEKRRFALAFAALVLGAVAMGASVLFVRWADVGPYASAFWRVFLALPFLWLWMRLENRATGIGALFSDRVVLLAGVLFTGDLFFWHLAILGTTVANATFLATTAPIWVALGAGLVLSEAVDRRILIGLALCMLGGFALLGESYGFAPQRFMGDLYGVATAVFCVIDTVILRPLPYAHPERIVSIQSISQSGYTQPASWPSCTSSRPPWTAGRPRSVWPTWTAPVPARRGCASGSRRCSAPIAAAATFWA